MQKVLDASGKAQLNLFLTQGLWSAAYCAYFSFIALYLSQNGYSPIKVGLAFTTISAVNFIAQPVTGYICDTKFDQKKILLFCTGCTIPCIFLTPIVVRVYPLVLVAIGLMTVFLYQLSGIIDSWTLTMMTKYTNIRYGVIRSGGALLFYIFALLFGFLFAVNINLMFVCCAVLTTALFFMGMRLPSPPKRVMGNIKLLGAAKILFKNAPYLFAVFSALFLYIFCGSFSVTVTASIKDFGADSSALGVILFAGVFTEVPTHIFFGKIFRRYKSGYTIILGLSIYAVRILLLFLAPNLGLFYLSQVLHGVGFAIFLNSIIIFINENIPHELKATGIMVYAAISNGLGSIFGNLICGNLAERFGVKSAYLFTMLGVIFAVLVLAVYIPLHYRRQRLFT